MAKQPSITAPIYGYNSHGLKHRASHDVLVWLDGELADLKRSYRLAEKEEEQSGHEYEYTIDRIQLGAQVDMLEYVKAYLESRD